MLVAACMSKLPKSMARNGPQANSPSWNASAVPKSTGTADAVRLKGLASRNHSLKTCARVGVAIRAIVERVVGFCNLSVHGRLKADGYCDTTGSRGSGPFQGTLELLPAAGPAQAVDQERVRAGRGGVRGEGFLGDRRGARTAGVRGLLRPLGRGVRGQRRARRGGGPQAPAQKVQARRER